MRLNDATPSLPPHCRGPRYYELLRPCALPRYAGSHGVTHLNGSLRISTTGSHVPYKSPEPRHATFTPDTTQPVDRLPLDSSRATTQDPVLMSPDRAFDASAVVRFLSSHRSPHDVSCHAFSLTLTTPALDRRSSGLFEASPRRAAPEGLPPSPSELRHVMNLRAPAVSRGTRVVARIETDPRTRNSCTNSGRLSCRVTVETDMAARGYAKASILRLLRKQAKRNRHVADSHAASVLTPNPETARKKPKAIVLVVADAVSSRTISRTA
jgi:hypothetical protein